MFCKPSYEDQDPLSEIIISSWDWNRGQSNWWRRSSARVWSIKYGEVAIVIKSAWSMMLRTWDMLRSILLIHVEGVHPGLWWNHISGARKSRSISIITGQRVEVRGERFEISLSVYSVLIWVISVINQLSIHGVMKLPILQCRCAKSRAYWWLWICDVSSVLELGHRSLCWSIWMSE